MKTAELADTLLDHFVAMADGKRLSADGKHWHWNQADGERLAFYDIPEDKWKPSTDWAQGGPIIEREEIAILPMEETEHGFWIAGFDPRVDEGRQCDSGWLDLPAIELEHEQCGFTPLIAAMRAYVASKFGEEVPDA